MYFDCVHGVCNLACVRTCQVAIQLQMREVTEPCQRCQLRKSCQGVVAQVQRAKLAVSAMQRHQATQAGYMVVRQQLHVANSASRVKWSGALGPHILHQIQNARAE